MPLHGFARDLDFEPIYISKDKVVLEQRECEETLKMFPYCYSLKIEHSITESGFSTTYTVRNLDKNEMTFNIGGHPGFNCPLRPEDGEFSDHSFIFDDAEGCTASNCNGRYFDDELPKLDHLHGITDRKLFVGSKSDRVSLIFRFIALCVVSGKSVPRLEADKR